MEKLHEAGCSVCSITADVESPIARAADVAVDMGCGHEAFLYRTVGVCTTIVTCWQIALTMGLAFGSIDDASIAEADAAMIAAIASMPARLNQAMAWYDEHRFELMRADYLMCAGAGRPVGGRPGSGHKGDGDGPHDHAELRARGDHPWAPERLRCIGGIRGFARRGADADKARAIAAFLSEKIGFCALVGNAGSGSDDCVFEEANDVFGALEHLTFAQVLAYRLADDHGRDLTRRINADISAYIAKEL